jgi:trehalose 6-phosphate phosphatase
MSTPARFRPAAAELLCAFVFGVAAYVRKQEVTGMKMMAAPDLHTDFLVRLHSAPERILLLDYDGTIAPFQVERHLATPFPEVPPLLREIAAAGTRVVFITGRPARELAPLTGIEPPPEVWGSHGMERLHPDGRYEVAPLPPFEVLGLARAARVLHQNSLDRDTEVKPGAVAVHWRGKPCSQIEQLKKELLRDWGNIATDHGLRMVQFDGGLEIRSPGRDKGDAVRAILQESKSGAAVAYLGDDQTDEDAFRALKGKGLTVLVGPEPRSTEADLWLRSPTELVEFLESWLRICGGEA